MDTYSASTLVKSFLDLVWLYIGKVWYIIYVILCWQWSVDKETNNVSDKPLTISLMQWRELVVYVYPASNPIVLPFSHNYIHVLTTLQFPWFGWRHQNSGSTLKTEHNMLCCYAEMDHEWECLGTSNSQMLHCVWMQVHHRPMRNRAVFITISSTKTCSATNICLIFILASADWHSCTQNSMCCTYMCKPGIHNKSNKYYNCMGAYGRVWVCYSAWSPWKSTGVTH